MGSINFIVFVVPKLAKVWGIDLIGNVKKAFNVFSKYVNIWLLYGIYELHCGINVYEKNSLVLILKDCSMKTRPSKTKILIWKFVPITHSIIYHRQKAKNSFW